MLSVLNLMRYYLPVSRVSTILVLLMLGTGSAYAAQSGPGFWEADSSATALPPLSASQIAQFLPSTRSTFTFPAPYNTTGIRVTLPSDCNGTNCVQYIGYSYWARMSNSTGLNSMWIMVGLSGHGGPTLYKLDKTTDAVTKNGPIFNHTNGSQECETMYFSHTMPNSLYYINDGLSSLNYIDVVTHVETQVFDINNYKSGDHIFQCSTSFNDLVSACTLEDNNFNILGCITYSSANGFKEYPMTTLNECNVSATGKYIELSDNADPTCSSGCDGSTVIVDTATGTETRIGNKVGGGGHYAMGYGYYTQNDNWETDYGAVKLWSFSGVPSPVGDILDVPYSNICTYNPTSCASVPSHPSWLNAVPNSVMPVAKQYLCDSTASTQSGSFANQVYCFYADASVAPVDKQSLVVAPTMINSTKTGCSGGSYGQQPKGNIDMTGHYFIWSANLDSNNNCQVFIVKIPTSQLPYPPPVVAPPQVSITSPPNDATVFGTVAAKVSVSADAGISNVTWKVDGQTVDSTDSAPYTYNLHTNTLSMGSHTLTATAVDVTGNKGSATIKIVVEQAPSSSNNGGGSGSLSFLPLALMG